jgi:secreted Zn-dependent insulinase-like peptidase
VLTATGVANWIDVLSTVYSYLGLLNTPEGMPFWMFDELKTIAQLKYGKNRLVSMYHVSAANLINIKF